MMAASLCRSMCLQVLLKINPKTFFYILYILGNNAFKIGFVCLCFNFSACCDVVNVGSADRIRISCFLVGVVPAHYDAQ